MAFQCRPQPTSDPQETHCTVVRHAQISWWELHCVKHFSQLGVRSSATKRFFRARDQEGGSTEKASGVVVWQTSSQASFCKEKAFVKAAQQRRVSLVKLAKKFNTWWLTLVFLQEGKKPFFQRTPLQWWLLLVVGLNKLSLIFTHPTTSLLDELKIPFLATADNPPSVPKLRPVDPGRFLALAQGYGFNLPTWLGSWFRAAIEEKNQRMIMGAEVGGRRR